MNTRKSIGKMKKRIKRFLAAINQDSMLAVMERPFPVYYYLLYDEDEIMEFHKEGIRQVRELLNDISEDELNKVQVHNRCKIGK